ncbi:MAG TPA: DUF1080 domain-containing protein, partial [Pirellulales bacterium]|nr:DUF1080 domain-containing protein [Pirellulales bacterium]
MPKIVRIAVAASLLFSFSKSLSAETVTATGVIDAVDRSSDTITVRRKTATGEKTAKFKLGGATKILFDGQVSGLHRFEAGQKVEVTYDTKAKQVTKLEAWPDSPAADNVPPDGFVALFNGKDLTGWKGVLAPPLDNAAKRAKASPGQLAKAQREADIEMRKHWSVRDGVLVFDGQGSSLATVKDYGDFELWVDWKIEPGGDSGIYLHGMPQVQIWDTANNAAKGVGSGGLQVVADKPVGEWNTFKITMVGERVNVTLNDVVVVDNVVLENFWEPKKPAYSTGPIELQKHGSRLYFKNIYLRELVRGGAENDVSAADADGNASELFNGKDLTGWSLKKPREIGIDNQWFVDRERKVLISPGGNGSNWLESEMRYKNFLLSLEYRFPPGGQQGGNGSGVVGTLPLSVGIGAITDNGSVQIDSNSIIDVANGGSLS